MTDNEATVAVPLSLIERLHAESVMGAGNRAALAALLPKPAPRLRVVDLDATSVDKYMTPRGGRAYVFENLESAPHVMTLIEQQIENWDRGGRVTSTARLVSRIRTAIEEAVDRG